MGFIKDLKLKKSTENQRNTMRESSKQMMQVYCNELKQYNAFDQNGQGCTTRWSNMIREVVGNQYLVGASKITTYQDPNIKPNYEFLFVDVSGNGEFEERYYTMSVNGNFTNKRGLVSFDINYLSIVNGVEVPYTATILANTSDLLDVSNMTIIPRISSQYGPGDNTHAPKQISDLYNILHEFVGFHDLARSFGDCEDVPDLW